MSTLREKAAQYIKDKGIPEIAKTLNVKEQTVKLWGTTGKYPIDLLELISGEDEPKTALEIRTALEDKLRESPPPIQELHPAEATWTPEALDKLSSTMSQVVDKLQELHEWKNGMDERFNPRPITPLPPSRNLPPTAVVEGGEFLEANAVRPGPIAPTPHLIRGEAPPAMLPPPQVAQPAGLNHRPVKHWLESYDYRERRR